MAIPRCEGDGCTAEARNRVQKRVGVPRGNGWRGNKWADRGPEMKLCDKCTRRLEDSTPFRGGEPRRGEVDYTVLLLPHAVPNTGTKGPEALARLFRIG